MSRVVLLNVRAHGHTIPTLPVVKELVGRGEDVHYYTWEEFREQVESTGARYRAYRSMPAYDIARLSGNPFELAAFLVEASQIVIPLILDEIRAEQPDYIIHDALCPWGKVIGQILHIPAATSIPFLPFNERSSRGSLKETIRLLRLLATGRSHIRRFHRSARALGEQYGIPPLTLVDAFNNHEPLNIVYTSRAFVPHQETFDDSYRFVGLSVMPHQDTGDFPLDRLIADRTIYISLGTVHNARPDFYQMCFQAFQDYDGCVVLSTGERVAIAALGDPPANFIVRDHVPQLDVLQRAILFITHGGMNSVQEGLYYGAPLLAIPQTYEQAGIADRVAQLGAGEVLPDKRLTAPTLRAAAERLLNTPIFRERSRQLGETLRAAGGYRQAANEIFAFKAAHGIQ